MALTVQRDSINAGARPAILSHRRQIRRLPRHYNRVAMRQSHCSICRRRMVSTVCWSTGEFWMSASEHPPCDDIFFAFCNTWDHCHGRAEFSAVAEVSLKLYTRNFSTLSPSETWVGLHTYFTSLCFSAWKNRASHFIVKSSRDVSHLRRNVFCARVRHALEDCQRLSSRIYKHNRITPRLLFWARKMKFGAKVDYKEKRRFPMHFLSRTIRTNLHKSIQELITYTQTTTYSR